MNRSLVIILCLALFACNQNNIEEDAVARVDDAYLYKEDILKIIPKGVSKTDSTLLVNNFINNWASGILLMKQARLNIPEDKQREFGGLVKQYESDLYTKTYLDALVKREIDTSVNAEEAELVYNSNKESFKLNDELLKLRYISLPLNAVNLEDIKMRFKNFENEDKVFLDSISVQFRSYSLNDSLWVKASQVIEKIPVVNPSNKNQLLKKSNFIQLKDSLNLYLVQINDVLLRNDFAPLDYVRSTVNQIITNKRKLELIKQIENEITKDAIKNKQFEIYK
ncbi:peptidyl-prolyl cis-trans isomerase [Winogradskyella sp.]|uniref:peptidyl-prolyl cis-trans isomerase n=1 Tax=Winogradskyella sp. TaxID=1883156 RepID=UPI0025E09A3C|nr:peptidyl-prolyl cis-trans isomerase [Winogradskyella sp.]